MPLVIDTSLGGLKELSKTTESALYPPLKTGSNSPKGNNSPNENNSPKTNFSLRTDAALSPKAMVTDALKRLVSDGAKKLQSPLVVRALDGGQTADGSVVSSPTVSCGTFSDDDFSLCSDNDDFLTQAKQLFSQQNIANCEVDDDLLSTSSSLNTHRQKQIAGLKKKLHTSEMTKLELLNQCAELWTKLEKAECNQVKLKTYRVENVKLREESATMERDFMNEVNKLVNEMKGMETKYTDQIAKQDGQILDLEEELSHLKMSSDPKLDE